MGYHRLDPDDVEPDEGRSATRRSLGSHLGLSKLGLNLYDIDPGEQAPLRYHYHTEQEEAFYVLEGELHVETEEGEYVVPAGEFFVAEPDHPHRAYNPADASGPVRTLAIGAPPVDDHEFPDEE
ncbi:MAG: cupin domain-containing protein [Halorhabdus sp.]